jgi:GNAT superfamily N-acetyltransferase
MAVNIDHLNIERGTFEDYKRLSRFHYKGSRPGAITGVFRIVHRAPTVVGRYLNRHDETQVVGVLVRSLPQLSCQLRNIATQNRYCGLPLRDAAVLLNREVRTISRVVIDPQWRGMGLAVRLVRQALEHPRDKADHQPRYTEALAAMGRVSPFFEHAGMTRYDRPPRPEHSRLIDALAHVGIEPVMLASAKLARERLATGEPGFEPFLLQELRRWCRAAHRTSKARLEQMSIDELLTAARDQLLAQPVYFLFQHERSGAEGVR